MLEFSQFFGVPLMQDFRTDAFISYRRSDGAAVAHWLRRELQGFRLPRALRALYGRRLRIYLDTAYERGAHDFYEQNIKPALLGARYLVVIATPDARQRPEGTEDWIAREIADFSAGPNAGNVIAVRGAGGFDDPLPADLKARFPNIEIVDLRGAGRFSWMNPSRAARLANEKLKLVAPLLELPHAEMPRLRQEEERRQQARLGASLGAALGVLVAVSGLSVYALQSRNQANRALDDSMFATGSMVILAQSLPVSSDRKAEGPGKVRRLLTNQGCDLIDKLSAGSDRDPGIAELVTCRLERAKGREEVKEHAEARAQFDEAIRLAAARDARTGRPDAGRWLVDARQVLAEYLARQGDMAAARAEYERLRDDGRRLAGVHRTRADPFRLAEAEGLGQIGDILIADGDRARGGENYDAAAATLAQLVIPSNENNGWLARLHRIAGEQRMNLEDAPGALERFGRALAARRLIPDASVSPEVELEAAVSSALIASLERRRGDQGAAEQAKADALERIGRIKSMPRLKVEVKNKAVGLERWIAQQFEAR